jgi:hypothetical protein
MENLDREELKKEMTMQGKLKVHDYWKQENDHDRWNGGFGTNSIHKIEIRSQQ